MPLDFGDNAAQPNGIKPPAPDKTPASPPVLAPQSPALVWLVLALALGYVAMNG